MTSLVPYVATELAKPENAAMAIDLIGEVGKAAANMYQERTKRKARKITRNTKREMKSMERIGERVGSSSTKWDTLNVVYTNMQAETLNQLQLLNVTKAAGSAAYDRRLKDQLNFRGIKVCMNIRADGAMGTAKGMMNVAIISPKSNLTSSDPIPNSEFFRDPTGNSRSIDFGDPALFSLDYYCSAINTDNYVVHKRMKFEFGPSNSTEGHKEKYIEFYLPVKRQIRYDATTAFPEGKNMYMVWWFNTSDGGTPLNPAQFSYRVTRYFKETLGL